VPDGSADLYHLMAGMILAAKEGLLSKNSLQKAKDLYVNVNIFEPEHKDLLDSLHALPSSCQDSSRHLKQDAEFYEKGGVFPAGTIENFVKKLSAFEDANLSDRLLGQKDEVKKLVDRYLHCM
jgi:glutamine synthetase